MTRAHSGGRTALVVGLVAGVLILLIAFFMLAGPGEGSRALARQGRAGAGQGRSGAVAVRGATRSRVEAGDEAEGTEGAGSGGRTGNGSAGERLSVGEEVDGALARTSLEGQLLDSSTNAPVAGARVQLEDPGRSVEALSDEGGRFALSWPAGAAADLRVEHPGYVDLHVAEVSFEEEATLLLLPSARILGRLEPVPEAPGAVALAWHQSASSHRYWSELQADVQADGTFVFADLDPGQYAVSARVPGMSVPIEYGFQLEPADELELRLEAMQGCTLYGKVVRGAAFEPAAGVEVMLRPGGPRLPPMMAELRTMLTTSASDGSYELTGVIPGSYRFRLTADEGDIKRGHLDIPADGLRLERDFQLPGPARVSGRVVDAGGQAVPRARVVAFAMGDTLRIMGVHSGEFDEDIPETFADADGGFLLANAPTQKPLVVIAYPPAFEPLRESCAAPGSIVLQGLGAGEIRAGLVIEIPPGERIVGTVRSAAGEPLADVTISAQRRFGEERFVSLGVAQTDGAGDFSIHPLLPGEYRVLATSERFWTSIEETEVDDGVAATVAIVLAQKLSVHGIARAPGGAGIANLPIRLRLDEDGAALVLEEETIQEIQRPTTVYGQTDAFGRFRVDDLYPGTWTVFGTSYDWELLVAEPDRLFVPAESYAELTLVPRVRRERFAITGVVALQEGGVPSGVKVEGLRGGFLEINGGAFKATGLVPTRHNLWVRSAGHARVRIPPIDPVPGGTVDLGRIELLPTTVLTVKLRADDGRTPDDAQVTLEPLPAAEGGSPLGRRLALTSRGGGRYRTDQATRHAWTLRVRHADFRNVKKRIEIREQAKQSRTIKLR